MIEIEKRPEIFECDECEEIKGNSVEFEVKKEDCEIRIDVKTEKRHCVRIWGQVKTCKGEGIEDALVKLVKVECKCGKFKLIGIAHTTTDCEGFYQFDICEKEKEKEFNKELDKECKKEEKKEEKEIYKIIVGKAAFGKERCTSDEGECRPCCKI